MCAPRACRQPVSTALCSPKLRACSTYVTGTRASRTSPRQTSAVQSRLPSFTKMISWPPATVSPSIVRTSAPMVSALL